MKTRKQYFLCFIIVALLLCIVSCANESQSSGSTGSSSTEENPAYDSKESQENNASHRDVPIVDGDYMSYWRSQEEIFWYDAPIKEKGRTYIAYGNTEWGTGRLTDDGYFAFDEYFEREDYPSHYIVGIEPRGDFWLRLKWGGNNSGSNVLPSLNRPGFFSYDEYLEMIEEKADKLPDNYIEPEWIGELLGVGLPTDGSLALHPEGDFHECIYRYQKEGFRTFEIHVEYLPEGAMDTSTLLDEHVEIRADGTRVYPLNVTIGFSEIYFSYDKANDLRTLKEGSYTPSGSDNYIFFNDNLVYKYVSGRLNLITFHIGDDILFSIHVTNEQEDGAPLDSLKDFYDYDTLEAAAASLATRLLNAED